MLRDSQGFETQIIDAVRSVNRALGGATGSTALRRSDYNQYEVQLIDAIRAIGRTLSGKGFVAGGGGGGDASGFATVQQFQDLSRRVSKLESESFFRLVDGNVTLKSEYQNLWVPGWLAVGGIGSGSGGGGGASFLNDLEDVDAPNPSDGDLLSWDGEAWVNIPQSTISPDLSGYGHALSLANNVATFFKDSNGNFLLDSNGRFLVNGASASINLLNGSGSVISSVNIPVASLDLSDYATKNWVQGQGYIAQETDPTVPAWAKQEEMQFSALPDLYALGTKVTDAPGLGILLGVSVMSANLATSAGGDTSRVQWDHVNDAWHFYGNVYVDGFLASGGIGSGGGGGYGVEEITSNEDGTVDFHFTGGDVTTVDLNHEHPQYPKYVVCTQAEYDALTTKDSDTLYLIPATV